MAYACNHGSEKLRQEDFGFEASQGYKSWFQVSWLHSKTNDSS